jgi:hypothetical protein
MRLWTATGNGAARDAGGGGEPVTRSVRKRLHLPLAAPIVKQVLLAEILAGGI